MARVYAFVMKGKTYKTADKDLADKLRKKKVKGYMENGGSGMAIGRNVWQDKDPLVLARKIKKVVWG